MEIKEEEQGERESETERYNVSIGSRSIRSPEIDLKNPKTKTKTKQKDQVRNLHNGKLQDLNSVRLIHTVTNVRRPFLEGESTRYCCYVEPFDNGPPPHFYLYSHSSQTYITS